MNESFSMKRLWMKVWMMAIVALGGASANAEIRLIGRVKIAGTSADKSGLTEKLEDGTSLSQLGGWSGIASTDEPDVYWLLPDRGPKDGAVSYPTRIHKIRLRFAGTENVKIQLEVLETLLLRNQEGESLIGLSAAFTGPDASLNLRFDPEGIRVLAKDRIAISDEYGPSVVVFDTKTGRATQWFSSPKHIVPQFLSADPDQEDSENTTGRQANGGYEGLAFQNESQTLLAFTQKPLLQDLSHSNEGKKVGKYCRITEFKLDGLPIAEYLYPLESGSTAVSEILGLGKSQALVLERDSKEGMESKLKGVYWIEYSEASDATNIPSVAPDQWDDKIRPVIKKPFINFLSSKFGIAGDKLPAKPEGLAFGPQLPDGSRTLIVSVDNDFESSQESELWIFSFELGDIPAS